MKRLAITTIGILFIATLLFAEYRFIMVNIKPYRGENGTVYIEMFGQIDEYYAPYYEIPAYN